MAHTSTSTHSAPLLAAGTLAAAQTAERSPVHSFMQAMPNGVVLLDARGYVQEANKEAKRLLGKALEGEAWRTIIHRAFRPQADDGHEVSLRSGRRVRLDISSLAPEPGQLIVLTDLSETRALLERISHLQRLTAMGRMLASLAHQIRTPLAAALLYADNLSRADLKQEQQQKFAQKVTECLKSLEQQVSDMLLYAKSGEQQPVKKLVIADIVAAALEQLQPSAERAGVQLTCLNQAAEAEIIGNAPALLGALQNIIENAIHASDVGAQVHVRVQSTHEQVQLQIKDWGQGMTEADLKQLFTPFFTKKAQGTGLGLAVVQTVVKAHQGQVSVCSELGQGTQFTLSFPLSGAQLESDHETAQKEVHDVAS